MLSSKSSTFFPMLRVVRVIIFVIIRPVSKSFVTEISGKQVEAIYSETCKSPSGKRLVAIPLLEEQLLPQTV